MRYFVFVDTAYYPYVDDVIEAASLADAEAKVAADLRPGDETTVYLVPEEAVTTVRMEGPKRAPVGLLKLLREHNRLAAARIEAKNLSGGYSVVGPDQQAWQRAAGAAPRLPGEPRAEERIRQIRDDW
jgi:hypothetical protein